ncbi:PTS IIA-like nitrogen regulatory protein PtsN [Aestuariirhabdus litorea]|uniref:PTS IIA-like nitrogen-regulatory protein PtsN n=1 Tax=Aestuariirhabdus litorea TaxID=2528527 RepID=A0A3P3VN03_9GAMM|nr:PTS IIA-like nitrogen regulatory protein PtsN [Aestuariirhabdus litorea]RRJ83717.1 PTS IIA-like nitrogen-regulatory protein PtsN [Aestuariirhabdus litorea]RWW96940.1 PTS IIA-like nitrogen-regulatory protein PtsN [Endozoicomonadaceae bacterium GTF-13]
MNLISLLSPDRSLCAAEGGSKKRVLETLAEALSHSGQEISAGELFNGLIERERLGSTGFGKGIAIPHCRLESCTEAIAALLKLSDGVDFDAMDDQPVDIIFALVVPNEATSEHLAILQELAGRLDNASYRNRLRTAKTSSELYQMAIAPLD